MSTTLSYPPPHIALRLTCLSRYAFNADDLVNDFVSLTSLVTKENLQALEVSYNQSQGVPTGISFPQMQAAASRFLGRLWAGSNSHTSVKSLNPNPSPSRPASTIRRSTSKQSLTSTLNSVESVSDASTAPTELSAAVDPRSRKSNMSTHHKDRDLHTQIEDLLMALSDLQRQHADLTRELQQEREEREEDQALSKEMLKYIQEQETENQPQDLISKVQSRFETTDPKDTAIPQTKQQLYDDMTRWKEMHQVEASRGLDLTRRMDDFEKENASLKEQLREARSRIQDGYRDRQRLERLNKELRALKMPETATPPETASTSVDSETASPTGTGGLRELRLVRTNSHKAPTFNKRSSSLGLQQVLATENHKPAAEDTLLLELVNAKTAEAVAKQELEEVKGKLDALRKMISKPHAQAGAKLENRHSFLGHSSAQGSISKSATEPARTPGTSSNVGAGGGGFFSGWGRRAPTNVESP